MYAKQEAVIAVDDDSAEEDVVNCSEVPRLDPRLLAAVSQQQDIGTLAGDKQLR